MKSIIGVFWLWVAILIFSASNSVVAKLGDLGAMHTFHGRNPISFCNLLFAGNVIAGIVLYIIYHKFWKKSVLKKLKTRDWLHMLGPTILSGVLAPTLFFLALITTEVINVILISTLEIPLTLFIAWLFFREHSPKGVIFGGIVAFIGVLFTFLFFDPSLGYQGTHSLQFGTAWLPDEIHRIPKGGEIAAAIATLLNVISTEINRKGLERIPTGIYIVFRMIIGTLVFFIIVMSLFGPSHFMDLTAPFLWEWMLAYGGIILVLGQIAWYLGIRQSTAAEVSIGNAFYPLAGILFSYLILGEIPQRAQIIGGVIIMGGIAISLISSLQHKKRTQTGLETPSSFIGV